MLDRHDGVVPVVDGGHGHGSPVGAASLPGFLPLQVPVNAGRYRASEAGALAEIAASGKPALARITGAVNAARRQAWAGIEARHGALPGVWIADKVLKGVICIRLDATVTPAGWTRRERSRTGLAWERTRAGTNRRPLGVLPSACHAVAQAPCGRATP